MVAEVMKMREEEKNQSSQLRKFFKKRWVYPTIYLFSAAILIGMITWYQSRSTNVVEPPTDEQPKTDEVADGEPNIPSVEVSKPVENISMPVEDMTGAEIITSFYDGEEAEATQEDALIVNGNEYYPSTGVAIANKDGEEFSVIAALSGKVSDVREDPLLGHVIEIEHEDGITTMYQSVKDVQVSKGDEVNQGKVIATSGRSQLNQSDVSQVFFEIRKHSQPLNPESYFGQSLSEIQSNDSETVSDEEEMDSEESSIEETEDDSEESSAEESQSEENDEATSTDNDLEKEQ